MSATNDEFIESIIWSAGRIRTALADPLGDQDSGELNKSLKELDSQLGSVLDCLEEGGYSE